MAATQFLAINGILNPKDYQYSASSINQLKKPVNDSDINSLINYYQLVQVTDSIYYNGIKVKNRTNKENINEIISLLETNSVVMVGIDYGHEILAYGVEYGTYTIDGVSYNGRILISDPNRCSNQFKDSQSF